MDKLKKLWQKAQPSITRQAANISGQSKKAFLKTKRGAKFAANKSKHAGFKAGSKAAATTKRAGTKARTAVKARRAGARVSAKSKRPRTRASAKSKRTTAKAATRLKSKRKTTRKRGNNFKGRAASGPPDVWWRRWLWYMNPVRFKDWWFTKQGGLAALRIAGVAAAIVLIGIVGLFMYFAKDLPNPGQINAMELEQTTRFYDRTGETVLYEVFGDKNRTFIELEEMGDHVANATIAIEDRKFYDQGAFSSLGIFRAAVYNVLSLDDGSLQGGSTITQQYVKNALLTPERTLDRKIKELILSMQIEQLYDKDDILELYLNEIGYGAQAYGVQAASQMYFSKDPDKLEVDEAAMLAALPQAPTYYSPYGQNTEALEARIDTVLGLMAEQGYITEEKAEKAIEENTLAKVNEVPDAYSDIKAPHFVMSVERELERRYGAKKVSQGGLEVITTIDLKKQKMAEKAVKNGMGAVENGGGNNTALVASNPNNGQVLAMVGSRGFGHPGFGSYNAATANRQPGSSFKPYVYAQAFESTKNWGAGSIMYDVRTDFGNYVPNNFDNSYRNNLTVRSALAESRNIPAVKMLYITGLKQTLKTVQDMGISTLKDPSRYGLSLVLGAGEVQLDEHVNGYETFANGGINHEQTKILKVTNPEDEVLEKWEKSEAESKRIFDPQVAYLISDILSDDSARAPTFGYNSSNLAVPGHTVAIKTGTTDDLRDGWMMGYTQDLTAGVWVGHNNNNPMTVATSNMTGPIFTDFMKSALKGKPNKPFQRPEGIKHVQLDKRTGNLASENSKETVTDIFPSWYEPSVEGAVKTAVIDKISGDLATKCTPERAKKKISSQGLQPEIPRDDPAYHRWNPPVQALADRLGMSSSGEIPEKKSDTHRDSSGNCTDGPEINSIDLKEDGENIKITIDVTENDHRVDEVILRYNGKQIRSFNRSGSQKYTHKYKHNGKKGKYTFKAEVIDKVLYHDTKTETIKVKGNESAFEETEDQPPDDGLPLNPSMIQPVIFWLWMF